MRGQAIQEATEPRTPLLFPEQMHRSEDDSNPIP